jgi:phosphosulfolactate synthase
MERKYNFNLNQLPSRTEKPRHEGVTMVMDKGISLRHAEDFVDTSADFVDIVKFGFGTSLITKHVKEKIKLYKDAGLKVYPGGTLFEAFIVRNQFDDFCNMLDDLGFDAAEVSDGSINLDHDRKCEYISKLAEKYTVFSEVGSKEEGVIIHPARWIKMMNTELEAGAYKVIAEARESGNVGIFHRNGTAHTMLINRIVNKVDPNRIIWETPQKGQQVYFLKLFGSNVNLGNISVDDVIPLETLRLGLRGDTFFTYLPASMKETIKKSDEMKEVTVAELKSMMDEQADFQLIDVREAYEFDEMNIKGQLIPMGEVIERAQEISKDKQVIVHCRSGARSASVISNLEKQFGFENLYNLKGGILAYIQEIGL